MGDSKEDHQANNVERLNQVFDTSSEKNRNALLSFLAVQLYLLITIASTTDLQLLLSNSIFSLPIINIGIPLVGFYIIAPILFLILHFNLLLNLAEHVDLLADWQQANQHSNHRFPYLINIIAYYQTTRSFRGVITKLVAILAIVVFPVAILIGFSVRFSDYHSLAITGLHSVLLLLDLYVLYKYLGGLKLPVLNLDRQWLTAVAVIFPMVFSLAIFVVVYVIVHYPMGIVKTVEFKTEGSETPWYIPHLDVREQQIATIKDAYKHTYSLAVEKSTHEYWTLYRRENLKGRNLSFANFTGVTLYNADLRGATLHGLIAHDGQFSGAIMRDVEAKGTKFYNASLMKADLSNADFSYGIFWNTDLRQADLGNSDFYQGFFSDAQLQGALMFSTEFKQATLNDSQLQGAVIVYAKMRESHLVNAQFQGAHIVGVDMSDSKLTQSNFDGAFLKNVKWLNVDIATLQMNYCVIKNLQLNQMTVSSVKLEHNQTNIGHCIVNWKNNDENQVLFSQLHNFAITEQNHDAEDFHQSRRKIACENPWTAYGLMLQQHEFSKDSHNKWWVDGAFKSFMEHDVLCRNNKIFEFLALNPITE